MAALQGGKFPSASWLLLGLGVTAFLMELVAMATDLAEFLGAVREKRQPETHVTEHIRSLALLLAVAVAVGAAVGFHWFSDVVAGVIIGTLVGVVVARAK